MSTLNDHERIGPLLASHERKWALQATQHEEGAERARARKAAQMGQHVRVPEGPRRMMESQHDAEIGRHERAARCCRRRAEHAAAGFLLHGPDEHRDGDYMRDHQDLIGLATRTGRIRHTGESVG